MSINYWRLADYDDDGCYIYQCLMCYKKWNARTEPGYHHEGVYHSYFNYCPCCGTKWEGKNVGADSDSYHNYKGLGSYRLKIKIALDKRWNNRKKLPKKAWVMEVKYDEKGKWSSSAQNYYSIEENSAYKMHELLNINRNICRGEFYRVRIAEVPSYITYLQ